MLSVFQDLYNVYFCQPIMGEAAPYNFINTITFALIALAIAFFIIYPLFKKNVKFDSKFALALVGFILLGSSARLIDDYYGSINVNLRTCEVLSPNFYLITPGIYLAVGIFAILALAFAVFAEKKFKIDKIKVFGIIGGIAALPFLAFAFLRYQQFYGLALVIAFFAVFFAIVYFLLKFLKINLLEDNLNKLAFSGQLLDGVATFTAIGFFGYWEQHPVSAGILAISPILFPIVKIALILAILYYADKEIEDKNLKGFIKILVLIFGMAPGLRDALTIGFSAMPAGIFG
ncbi:MAG: DUF63 family protein [Candidatus Diapherotrites archaeon]|nr:DUF63 family protein [Candidatus Diapherotrites archaeon]